MFEVLRRPRIFAGTSNLNDHSRRSLVSLYRFAWNSKHDVTFTPDINEHIELANLAKREEAEIDSRLEISSRRSYYL